VGFKIVVSSKEQFEDYANEIKFRKENNIDGIPDFISVDGGDGGTATAPIFLMDSVGFSVRDSIFIVDSVLKQYGLREDIKIIASSKILTPDDIAIILALGADFTSIGRGFMLSAGCIRARMCSGAGSHQCPVGLATQDKQLRRTYLMYKQAQKVANYHKKLIDGVRTILAVMGKVSIEELTHEDLTFIDRNGFIHSDIEVYYKKKVKES
jgi:glutamate synthase domain-containing protein 2